MKNMGGLLILFGAASAESEWIWIPWLLLGAGAVFMITKKKTSYCRTAEKCFIANILQTNCNTDKRRISDER